MIVAKYRNRKVDGRWISEHRLVWEQAHGPIPAGMIVHHINGDRRDNRLENLQLMTRAEHSAHHNDRHPREKQCAQCGATFMPHPTKRLRAKTCSRECFRAHMRGKRNNAKLSTQDYVAIRRRIDAGEMQKTLACEYGVSPATITRIKKAK